MIITTTNNIETKKVLKYKGVVFGEVIAGINVLKDMGAGLTNFFGGRSRVMKKNYYMLELKH